METNVVSPGPAWWTTPGETDMLAWLALGFLFAALFLVIFLYAKFDQYTEHRAKSTPLRSTIPTMLVIGFAYEILPPLSHFSYLLPLALIAAALARDIMLWWSPERPPVTEVSGRD